LGIGLQVMWLSLMKLLVQVFSPSSIDSQSDPIALGAVLR
jgi:uncharacterized membrane-anchored protein